MASAEEYSGDTLHWSSKGSHVLFSFIQLDFGGFMFTAVICALERFLTLAFESRWAPASIRRGRAANALWRAGLYWVLSLLRLAYMLIAMTLNAGLILTAVTTLALGQLVIELWTPPQRRDRYYASLEETPMFTMTSCEDVITESSRKPDGIFLPPTPSNVAAALSGNAERVQGTRYSHEAATWEAGNGPDVARSLLGNTKRGGVRSGRAPFEVGGVGDDSDSDS